MIAFLENDHMNGRMSKMKLTWYKDDDDIPEMFISEVLSFYNN